MTETDKITLMNEAADFLAKVWKRISAPVSYERETSVDGVKVRITVDYGEGKLKEAAKPKSKKIDESNERLGYD